MTLTRCLTLALLAFPLAACDGTRFDSDLPGGNENLADNEAPLITGKPATAAIVGEPYSFRPSAHDPDGDTLRFQAEQLPSWATLDVATGEVSGIPPMEAAGTTARVAIEVTDGELMARLPAFTVSVAAKTSPAPDTPRSATLEWTRPLQNDDGTPLMDLAGYRVYYGNEPAQLGARLDVPNPDATGATVADLAPGEWHFAVSSVNKAGVESPKSLTVAIVLN